MYTIKQAAERTKLSEHTIRYYDREGLLPLLTRTKSGVRNFSEDDIAWLLLICCLKDSGMPIQRIKDFMELCLSGSKTCEERKEILLDHKMHIINQLNLLNTSLETINYKIDHYKDIGVFHIDKQLADT